MQSVGTVPLGLVPLRSSAGVESFGTVPLDPLSAGTGPFGLVGSGLGGTTASSLPLVGTGPGGVVASFLGTSLGLAGLARLTFPFVGFG